MSERRTYHRYPVKWKARVLLADRSLYQVVVKDISKGGAAILFEYALAVKTPVNIEISIPSKTSTIRIRAKTQVAHQTILASGLALLGLVFVDISNDDQHTLNNTLQQLGGE